MSDQGFFDYAADMYGDYEFLKIIITDKEDKILKAEGIDNFEYREFCQIIISLFAHELDIRGANEYNLRMMLRELELEKEVYGDDEEEA